MAFSLYDMASPFGVRLWTRKSDCMNLHLARFTSASASHRTGVGLRTCYMYTTHYNLSTSRLVCAPFWVARTDKVIAVRLAWLTCPSPTQ